MYPNPDPRRPEHFVDRISIVLALVVIIFSIGFAVMIGALWFT